MHCQKVLQYSRTRRNTHAQLRIDQYMCTLYVLQGICFLLLRGVSPLTCQSLRAHRTSNHIKMFVPNLSVPAWPLHRQRRFTGFLSHIEGNPDTSETITRIVAKTRAIERALNTADLILHSRTLRGMRSSENQHK